MFKKGHLLSYYGNTIRSKWLLSFQLYDPETGHLEQGGALQHAGGAAHLPDGVHGQLRRSDVGHGDAEPRRQDGADGGPTGAVVTYHHIL